MITLIRKHMYIHMNHEITMNTVVQILNQRYELSL